jgi:muramoyltetrapeptide carboxypeptidase
LRFPFLKRGDGIGLIAPAGHVSHQDIRMGTSILEKEGFRVRPAPHLYGKYRYFSGTLSQRTSDIHHFLDEPDIQALYAVRGGSGSSQLLPYLNYEKWKKSGKPLIGFSDISALQWAIWYRAGIVSFSGMTLTFQLQKSNPYLKLFFRQILQQRKSITLHDLKKNSPIVERSGKTKGILLGGTLSIIVSLLGTPFFPGLNQDIILFLEEVNEQIYRIERAIVQLEQAGFFNRVKAVILGRFIYEDEPLEIWPSLKSHFPPNIPVILNFPYGHFPDACALPQGVPAILETDPFRIVWNIRP